MIARTSSPTININKILSELSCEIMDIFTYDNNKLSASPGKDVVGKDIVKLQYLHACNIQILRSTDLQRFLVELVRRICPKIEEFFPLEIILFILITFFLEYMYVLIF